ncbi:LysM peptidoglycan-binding domain-containing protein [Kistimonas asteriae]|uniref:LysM peptidoglycan-binding domain-containing protein n=1 Tax=Kistimonas asteriae TaxID=517724 RepID=UPI001BA88220|nr:LysM domain-containing protein [Kistimonas asteriae]
MKKLLLGCVLWSLSMIAWGEASDEMFRDDRPESYTVVPGDTLWEISGRFLKSPWRWPEVWDMNSQINNPHLIYPGDVINLVYIDGKPHLTVSRNGQSATGDGRTIKLIPKIRKQRLADAIPAIPLDAISGFLSHSRIVSIPETLTNAPYIVSGKEDRLISAAGDLIYARGVVEDEITRFGVYRKQQVITDLETNEVLGIMALGLGSATLKKVNGDLLSLRVTRASEEIRGGDRLLVSEERGLAPSFMPSVPEDREMRARILHVISGVNQIGRFHNVIINKGERENLKTGNVMAIYKDVEVRDRFADEVITLPPERVGVLMVYRTFEKVSYGVVLKASQPLRIGDLLKAP